MEFKIIKVIFFPLFFFIKRQNNISSEMHVSYRIFRWSRIWDLIKFFAMFVEGRRLSGLAVDFKNERFCGWFYDSEGILEISFGSTFNFVCVFFEELVEHVRIEGRRFNEGISSIVLIARYLFGHPPVISLMFVLRIIVQRIRCYRYRILKNPQVVRLCSKHLGRVCSHFHEIPRVTQRTS